MRAVNRLPACTRVPHQFSHLFAGGDATGCSSDRWADALRADACIDIEHVPGQVAHTGARFRRQDLSRGGSRGVADDVRASLIGIAA
ncbi:oligopeptidase A [Xanthomonas bromi]|uniref:Oligopeptidase A n=1 Tax=Xanthomonas bromi TaxID=56449 RepID=A0A1C3NRT0_9XANT|nr:hypothetical protein XbrCFBP1976_19890 [Xanthomonas bromi]SBV53066.1 oligopeptidase A [Xanthomonas bromi]